MREVNEVTGLIIGVGVATLVLIFIGSLGGQTYNVAEPDITAIGGTIVNESLGTTDANGQLTAYTQYTPIVEGSEKVYAGGTLLTTNYTINYETGEVVVDDPNYPNTEITIDYQYGDPTVASNVKDSIINSFKALSQTGKYMPLIVLAIVISIVLGLVVGLGGRFGGAGGYYGGAL